METNIVLLWYFLTGCFKVSISNIPAEVTLRPFRNTWE